MHILFVADGRSPTTRSWIRTVRALQHEISLVSTYPCDPLPEAKNTFILPVAFSGQASRKSPASPLTPSSPHSTPEASQKRRLLQRFRGAFVKVRAWLGPLTLAASATQFSRIVTELKPDLVHALRIPFEGMLAAATPAGIPTILSIWGNDLTLHAPSSPWMRARTMQALHRAGGVIADAQRDIRLAHQWGFPYDRPDLVAPGNGGIDLANLRQEASLAALITQPVSGPMVINPRGLRGYVRNDTFFQAIPLVWERNPQVHFMATAMSGQAEAAQWVNRLKLDQRMQLLPNLNQGQLWKLMMQCAILTSISSHDGTPNTLLEGMACGCFPIVGDLESLREWIIPGKNGLLVEPGKAQDLASALLLALEEPELRLAAAETNLRLVQERAEINLVRAQIEIFYKRCLKQ